jgi:hypothetical protein
MSKQLIYAAFNAGKELLSVGVASAPLTSDYLTLYRMQRKYHGIPDIIVLEEFEGDWKPIKEIWKFRLKHIFSPVWDSTQPDSVNRARKAKLVDQFFKDHELISGVDFLREKDKRGPVFTPLHLQVTS